MELRQKFIELYNQIKENQYFCNDDMLVGTNTYNSALLLGMISAATNKSILYVGEYGLGKTSLAESISSLIFSLPIDLVESCSLKGNPEMSYEQIIGRPDLGELNQGKEKIIWSNFVLSKSKVIDEINRIPEHKQNIILTGMQSNSWKYLNAFLKTDAGPWFATKNYQDTGNNGIIPPLLDRFSLCVESKHPGVNNSRLIRFTEKQNLENPGITEAHETILQTKDLTYDEYNKTMHILKDEFRKTIKNNFGVNLFEESDLAEINNQINSVKFSNDSNYLLDIVNAELGSCQLFGQKRSHEQCPEDCHYSNYACFSVKNGISMRSLNAIHHFSKGLAWLDDKTEVNPGLVRSILPFALWHKTKFSEQMIESNQYSQRNGSLEFSCMDSLAEEIYNRANQVRKTQISFTTEILNENYDKAKKIAESQDHPVFRGYIG